ncbi:MAG: hypothetical protein PHP52_11685, partial [Bacteroidales bacterium]|nr:hypothetical protein [Bacteroidales bacterium]
HVICTVASFSLVKALKYDGISTLASPLSFNNILPLYITKASGDSIQVCLSNSFSGFSGLSIKKFLVAASSSPVEYTLPMKYPPNSG